MERCHTLSRSKRLISSIVDLRLVNISAAVAGLVPGCGTGSNPSSNGTDGLSTNEASPAATPVAAVSAEDRAVAFPPDWEEATDIAKSNEAEEE
jgi:hypothetical protein